MKAETEEVFLKSVLCCISFILLCSWSYNNFFLLAVHCPNRLVVITIFILAEINRERGYKIHYCLG